MASGCATRSSSAKSAFLTVRSSTTDSITRSHSTRPSSWSVAETRPYLGLLVRRELALGHLTVQVPGQPGQEAVGRRRVRDRTITSHPALAATSASPEPMIPEPRTPTRLITIPAIAVCYRRVRWRGSRCCGWGTTVAAAVTDDRVQR